MKSGNITTEKVIWCAISADWDRRPSGGHVEQWRKEGWIYHREEGWICPKCAVGFAKTPKKPLEWTNNCRCGATIAGSTAKRWREQGWVNRRKEGWVCPKCAKETKPSKGASCEG